MAVSDRNRQIFEGAGLDAIKLELAFGGTRFNLARPEIAAEAREWLAETEAKNWEERQARERLQRRRYRAALAWTIVAAIAGIVAAAAGLIQLFK